MKMRRGTIDAMGWGHFFEINRYYVWWSHMIHCLTEQAMEVLTLISMACSSFKSALSELYSLWSCMAIENYLQPETDWPLYRIETYVNIWNFRWLAVNLVWSCKLGSWTWICGFWTSTCSTDSEPVIEKIQAQGSLHGPWRLCHNPSLAQNIHNFGTCVLSFHPNTSDHRVIFEDCDEFSTKDLRCTASWRNEQLVRAKSSWLSEIRAFSERAKLQTTMAWEGE